MHLISWLSWGLMIEIVLVDRIYHFFYIAVTFGTPDYSFSSMRLTRCLLKLSCRNISFEWTLIEFNRYFSRVSLKTCLMIHWHGEAGSSAGRLFQLSLYFSAFAVNFENLRHSLCVGEVFLKQYIARNVVTSQKLLEATRCGNYAVMISVKYPWHIVSLQHVAYRRYAMKKAVVNGPVRLA